MIDGNTLRPDKTTMKSRSKWFKLVWIIPAILIVLALIVTTARGVRSLPLVQSFLREYPGISALPVRAPVGFPLWVALLHFLCMFFLMFIIRSGWQIRTTQRPVAYWTRRNTGPIRTPGAPVKIGLHVWFHITMNVLWIANGILFLVLLLSTGQWVRVIPTRWDVLPNALSAMLQYASLDWPIDDGWVNYNALQLLTYFVTIFIAAPLAVLTGIRLAPGLAARFKKIERVYPIQLARAIHFPVMVYFSAFIIVHVALVLMTGALSNLNHMYALRDDQTWVGFWIFTASIVIMVAGWIAARPILLRTAASLTGDVRRS